MELNGKIALVLGSAKGIGKAIGFALAAEGATVILTHHDWPEDATLMRRELDELAGDHLGSTISNGAACRLSMVRMTGRSILANGTWKWIQP
jgi:NAD(P)-dependent dehydrogenase (short-subunit alcohol dehydrogenase family)